ncbi:hypothetical protein C8Q70DRAFT_938075 [Cubamyces menziesii]|nr:hypothetical protein C8Q70DRAFT_938075 [Cubamyces menziesii]
MGMDQDVVDYPPHQVCNIREEAFPPCTGLRGVGLAGHNALQKHLQPCPYCTGYGICGLISSAACSADERNSIITLPTCPVPQRDGANISTYAVASMIGRVNPAQPTQEDLQTLGHNDTFTRGDMPTIDDGGRVRMEHDPTAFWTGQCSSSVGWVDRGQEGYRDEGVDETGSGTSGCGGWELLSGLGAKNHAAQPEEISISRKVKIFMGLQYVCYKEAPTLPDSSHPDLADSEVVELPMLLRGLAMSDSWWDIFPSICGNVLALYRHLAAHVSWIDIKAAASRKNQVMEHVTDKITELAAAESVRNGVASMHQYTPSSHIPVLVQFLFKQGTFGTSAPERIDLATNNVWQMTNGCKYFPNPITAYKTVALPSSGYALTWR